MKINEVCFVSLRFILLFVFLCEDAGKKIQNILYGNIS